MKGGGRLLPDGHLVLVGIVADEVEGLGVVGMVIGGGEVDGHREFELCAAGDVFEEGRDVEEALADHQHPRVLVPLPLLQPFPVVD